MRSLAALFVSGIFVSVTALSLARSARSEEALTAIRGTSERARSAPGLNEFAPEHPIARGARTVVERYEERGAFSGAVLLAQGDRSIELETRLTDARSETPNQAPALFRIGSLSKHFVATALLVLEERARLRLGDPLHKYLPEYPNGSLELGGTHVTLHYMLQHTSGLPEYDAMRSSAFSEQVAPLAPSELIQRMKQHELTSVPGARYVYNNANYDLLGVVVERVSGENLDSFVRQLVARAGAFDIGIQPTSSERSRLARGHVRFATLSLDVHRAFAAPFEAFPTAAGSGNCFASARGLFRWLEALFAGRVVSPAALARMLKPGRSQYGYGVIIDEIAGWKRIHHAGNVPGFASHFEYFPEQRAALIILSNTDARDTPMRELSDDLRRVLQNDFLEAELRVPEKPLTARALDTTRVAVRAAFSQSWHGLVLKGFVVLSIAMGITRDRSVDTRIYTNGLARLAALFMVLAFAGAGDGLIGVLAGLATLLLGLNVRSLWSVSCPVARDPKRSRFAFELGLISKMRSFGGGAPKPGVGPQKIHSFGAGLRPDEKKLERRPSMGCVLVLAMSMLAVALWLLGGQFWVALLGVLFGVALSWVLPTALLPFYARTFTFER